MQRAQLPGVFTVASCQVALGAGTYTEVVNGGRARFEGIAVVGP